MATTYTEAVRFAGPVTFTGTVSLPAGAVGNTAIPDAADVGDEKLRHRVALNYAQPPGTAVVAATQDLFYVTSANGGSVLSVNAVVTGAVATGADRDVSIDLQRSTGGGAFATILSAPVVLDDASALRTAEAGAISSAALVTGDLLRLVITVTGAAGNQAQGLLVSVLVMQRA